MNIAEGKIQAFLEAQSRDFGAKAEIDPGLWSLFVVPAADEDARTVAQALLAEVGFAHDSGLTEDDQWMLYYVDTANRDAAIHWMDDLLRILTGKIRLPSPAQSDLIDDLLASKMPHRVAQKLAEQHTNGEISAGSIDNPDMVRALLDRLHLMEPLYFSAFQLLLANHLIDLVVLLRQINDDDVALENQITKSSVSRDPFLQTRQDAASNIRHLLIEYHIINTMDQQKNTTIGNPYAAMTDVFLDGDNILAHIDGNKVNLPRQSFLKAIHSIRSNLYRGDKFESFNTQTPWMSEDISYPFRFIKQQLDLNRNFTPMDWLFMLERAV